MLYRSRNSAVERMVGEWLGRVRNAIVAMNEAKNFRYNRKVQGENFKDGIKGLPFTTTLFISIINATYLVVYLSKKKSPLHPENNYLHTENFVTTYNNLRQRTQPHIHTHTK